MKREVGEGEAAEEGMIIGRGGKERRFPLTDVKLWGRLSFKLN